MNPFNLYEAYTAVYDEDLRDELEVIDEDLSFIDDLSDNELTQIMEEILRDREVSLNECYYAFDEVVLSEETELQRMNRLQNKATRERKSAAATAGRMKSAERERVGRKHAVKRLQVATGRAAERIRSGADSAKTMAGGAISALAGGAAEAGRKGKAAAQRVGGKLAAAKERISGFVKKVGRAAGAGASAARAEFSGQAAREARARDTGRAMRRAARRGARGSGPSPFDEPTSPEKATGKQIKDTAQKLISGAPERKALPPVGTTKAGKPLTASQRKMQTSTQNRKLAQRLGVSEETILMAASILEDLLQEGYASDYNEALHILESMSDYEVGELAESYLVEEVETDDLYDVVLEHLLEEGYAETVEDATTIMANMSEEWRDEILEANRFDSEMGLDDELKSYRRNVSQDRDADQRRFKHKLVRGQKKRKGVKSSYDTLGNMIRSKYRQQQFKRTGNPLYKD